MGVKSIFGRWRATNIFGHGRAINIFGHLRGITIFGHVRAINIFGHWRAINIFVHGRAISDFNFGVNLGASCGHLGGNLRATGGQDNLGQGNLSLSQLILPCNLCKSTLFYALKGLLDER